MTPDRNAIPAGDRVEASASPIPAGLTAAALPAEITLQAPAEADVDRGRRLISGVLVPPGSMTANTSAGPTRFRYGSLEFAADVRRVALNLEHQRADALGYATSIEWSPVAGLVATFHLPPSNDPVEEARRLRALDDAASGVRNGLSVEAQFPPGARVEIDGVDGTLDVIAGARLRAVGLVSVPAFDDSRVTHVAATAPQLATPGGTMYCTSCQQVHAPGTPCPTVAASTPPTPAPAPAPAPAPTPPPAPAPNPAPPAPTEPQTITASAVLDELFDRLRSGQLAPVGAPGPSSPGATPAPAGAPAGGPRELRLADFAALVSAQYMGAADEATVRDLRAALADITPADMPSAFRPTYLTELWDGADFERKFIDNATTTRPLPRALKVVGKRWTTRPIVDDYAGNKAEVPTNEPALEDVEVNVARLAGAHDVDRALIDLGSPEWLADYFEAQTEDYRRKTDARAATAAWNGATVIADGNGVGAGEADTLIGGVVAAVIELATDGQGIEYVAMAPGLMVELFGLTRDQAPAFFGGAFQLSGKGDGNLGGTTWFTAPGLPAGGFLVGSKSAIRWHEFEPPIRVQAVNVAQGGIDLGVFGYYATYVRDPRRVRKGTVAPAA